MSFIYREYKPVPKTLVSTIREMRIFLLHITRHKSSRFISSSIGSIRLSSNPSSMKPFLNGCQSRFHAVNMSNIFWQIYPILKQLPQTCTDKYGLLYGEQRYKAVSFSQSFLVCESRLEAPTSGCGYFTHLK